MNLFYLHYDPQICAQNHCDKHVVKMIVEYAQLLSSAHRLLDGQEIGVEHATRTHIFGAPEEVKFKRKKFWQMPGENLAIRTERTAIHPTEGAALLMIEEGVFIDCHTTEELCVGYEDKDFLESDNPLYFASHMLHPCALWLRAADGNYNFLASLFKHLCAEYTYRYGKVHSTERKLLDLLSHVPKNIPAGDFCPPPLAMPGEYKVEHAITAYQNLYVGEKSRFAKWTNRKPPQWFISRTPSYDSSHFERTRHLVGTTPEGG